jgi:zinc protease
MGGFSPTELSRMLAGRIAQASPSIGDYTHGINGSSTPRDLETALKLNYLVHTAPNQSAETFDLLKRRLEGALANQAQNPRAVFGEKVEQVNTSNHYTAQALKVADLPALDLDVMQRIYTARFANAADFTYFFVGAFSVDDVTPLLETWIGSLPSSGKKSSTVRDMGVKFPTAVVREEVRKGKEPASQTVVSFFADTGLDEYEMHRARAAASVLGIRLREILREELGGTYGVNVGYDNALPMKGYGAMTVQFGSAPENVEKLVKAVFDEVARLQKEGPSPDDVNKVKEMERRDLETNARQNSYWIGSLQTVHMVGWDPTGIARRPERTEKLTPEILHEMFRKYFPMNRHTVVTLKPEA